MRRLSPSLLPAIKHILNIALSQDFHKQKRIMQTTSLAQSLPSDLLELVFFWLVESDREQARLAFDRDEEERRQTRLPPARRDGPRLDKIDRSFAGESRGLRSACLVCKDWRA